MSDERSRRFANFRIVDFSGFRESNLKDHGRVTRRKQKKMEIAVVVAATTEEMVEDAEKSVFVVSD